MGNQFGFTPGRSKMEAIHFIERIMKFHRDRENDLYMVSFDLSKVYDRISREVRTMDVLGEESFFKLLYSSY